ncbi:amidohydrolase family protein [Paenibacillus hamazuiensis]|uniref:amidohydrolase family protein n=1 Tax=Paenibacillus hamazuiensis TaxID=2936508 RepID=UPI00200E9C47|nr:amidohydrolase family protein [Paenibacillus hamazuiensis]
MTREMIDMFCHFMPEVYYKKVEQLCGSAAHMLDRAYQLPTMSNLDARLKMMDKFEGYRQVPSMVSPALEAFASEDVSPVLARLANEEMASIVSKYNDYFPAFVATLPVNNIEAALIEAEYAIKVLGAKGVQFFTNTTSKALDHHDYFTIYETVNRAGGAIWIHPTRTMFTPDYKGEEASKYEMWWSLGWPVDSSLAMARLAFSGLFEKYPEIRVITHHVGGIIPMVAGRFASGMEDFGTRTPKQYAYLVETPLTEPPVNALKRFYADTASFGAKAPIACGIDFFGIDKIVFASDMPFGPEAGYHHIKETIQAIEALDIPEEHKEMIFSGNANRLLNL